MTSVKVCGLTTQEMAVVAWEAGADYLGLVLTDSSRRVTLEEAEEIQSRIPSARFVAVGRHVDDELFRDMLHLPVWGIQLHGRTPAHWIDRVHQAGKHAIATILDAQADIVLLDNVVPGSGQPWQWEKPTFLRPIWLAGGLSPQNVREVVSRLHPDGVDVSSGVESQGEKTAELIRRFIQEVQYGDNRSA